MKIAVKTRLAAARKKLSLIKIFIEMNPDQRFVLFLAVSIALHLTFIFYHQGYNVSENTETVLMPGEMDFSTAEQSGPAGQPATPDVDTESSDTGKSSVKQSESSEGTGGTGGAVDLGFMPDVVAPKPVGALMKKYPKAASEQGIEAIAYVEIMIDANGQVKAVNVVGVKLSKDMLPDAAEAMKKLFAADAVTILMAAKFTPPVVKGKSVPVKMDMPLNFKLED